ncbi:MAG: hypothetical protein R3B13_06810 [Polyangiaceae bacterium]
MQTTTETTSNHDAHRGGTASQRPGISLDLPRLRRDLRELVARSLELKATLRRPWQAPMAELQSELTEVRRLTTERLVLLAWTRGKLHIRSIPQVGRVPGTDDLYVQVPGTYSTRLVRFTPESYRDLIAGALAPSYALDPVEPSHDG